MAGALSIMLSLPAAADALRPTIFDLPLGATASSLPGPRHFSLLACGSNGGPPGETIVGWTDYHQCRAEADGLHEVYFEYDDEAEYVARAHDDYVAGWTAGTNIDSFPVITSVLFDDEGSAEAERIVTDPRPEQRRDGFLHLRPRQEHYLLGLYLLDRFGMNASNCHDAPAAPGESPMLGMFVKQNCAAVVGDRSYTIQSRLLRRPGESDVDPATGMQTEGAFLSETRAEIRLVHK